MKLGESISRRCFIVLAGGAVLGPPLAWSAADVPTLLDHFILGCDDLDRGIALVEKQTGVHAVFGGVHPGRGTRNALLSLGERKYLEIMAPDPAQQVTLQIPRLRKLNEPRIVGWAVHPGDLQQFAAHLREKGIAFEGPRPGSRERPDGRVLKWKTVTLQNDRGGLLPFFIEWGADSVHPSADAPKGCTLLHFRAATPESEDLAHAAALLQLDLPVSVSKEPALRATIAGPKGALALTS
jgi:Glyoxalase-like domain